MEICTRENPYPGQDALHVATYTMMGTLKQEVSSLHCKVEPELLFWRTYLHLSLCVNAIDYGQSHVDRGRPAEALLRLEPRQEALF